MKLKYLVAALGLLASAASQAAIMNSASTNGSEMFLSVWEQGAASGAPDQSFTFDTGITYNQFLAGDSVSSILATLSTSDSVWTNFLATSDLGSLQWAAIASNAHNPLAIMSTVTVGQEASVATEDSTAIVNANTQLSTFLANVNTTGTHGSQANGESVNLTGSNAYFQGLGLSNFNGKGWSNSNAIGDTAEFTQAVRNVATSGVIETVQAGTMTFAEQGDGSYVLSYNVPAVPEPTGIGMALAGMLGIGFFSLRRKKQ